VLHLQVALAREAVSLHAGDVLDVKVDAVWVARAVAGVVIKQCSKARLS